MPVPVPVPVPVPAPVPAPISISVPVPIPIFEFGPRYPEPGFYMVTDIICPLVTFAVATAPVPLPQGSSIETYGGVEYPVPEF